MSKKHKTKKLNARATLPSAKSESRFFKRFFNIRYIIIFTFLFSGYLSLKNLGATYFWDDEAETGIIAKNLITTGKLTGWDGRNLYATRTGNALDENLRPINPPLYFYVCAASFKIFGISEWAGRFPSVIAGLLAIAVMMRLLKLEFGKNEWLWFYSLGFLILSPSFFLNIRQCRYYAFAMLFSLLIFYFYKRCLVKKRISYFIFLSLFSILLFYTHYLLLAAFSLSIIVYHFLFHRKDLEIKEWWKVLVAVAIFLIGTVPYAVHYKIWHRTDILIEDSWYHHKLTLLWWNFRDLNLIAVMPWTVFIIFIHLLIYYRKKDYRKKDLIVTQTIRWLVLALCNVFFIAILSPQQTVKLCPADARYLAVSIPFLAVSVGIFLFLINNWNKILAFFIFIVLITSNVLSLTMFSMDIKPTFKWLLPAYLYEIHHEFPTTYSTVIKYLSENASQDDFVFSYPDYAIYPLMFHLSEKLKFCCTLFSDTPLPIEQKMKKLAPYLFIKDEYENYPDWFIAYGYKEKTKEFLSRFSRPHKRKGNHEQFKYTCVSTLNVFYFDTSRPELHWHSFGPHKNFDPKIEGVYIFKRSKLEDKDIRGVKDSSFSGELKFLQE